MVGQSAQQARDMWITAIANRQLPDDTPRAMVVGSKPSAHVEWVAKVRKQLFPQRFCHDVRQHVARWYVQKGDVILFDMFSQIVMLDVYEFAAFCRSGLLSDLDGREVVYMDGYMSLWLTDKVKQPAKPLCILYDGRSGYIFRLASEQCLDFLLLRTPCYCRVVVEVNFAGYRLAVLGMSSVVHISVRLEMMTFFCFTGLYTRPRFRVLWM